jgi:hypothetical protein
MSTDTITEATNISSQEFAEQAIPCPNGKTYLYGSVIRNDATYEDHPWNGSLARFMTSEAAAQHARAYMRENNLSEDDYSVRTSTYTFVGSPHGKDKPDPWDAVKAKCTCVPGTIKVVQEMMSDFVSFIEDQGWAVKNAEDLGSIDEILDNLSFIDVDDILSNLQTAIDALGEANDAMSEAEMYDEQSEVETAMNSVNSAINAIRR